MWVLRPHYEKKHKANAVGQWLPLPLGRVIASHVYSGNLKVELQICDNGRCSAVRFGGPQGIHPSRAWVLEGTIPHARSREHLMHSIILSIGLHPHKTLQAKVAIDWAMRQEFDFRSLADLGVGKKLVALCNSVSLDLVVTAKLRSLQAAWRACMKEKKEHQDQIDQSASSFV